MKNYKIKIISLFFVLILSAFLWQSCNIAEAIYQTVEEELFSNSGHADLSAEAFTHWDEDEPPVISTRCAKCHSANGFLDFAADGSVDNDADPGVLTCAVCHTNEETGARRQFDSVTFPSGATINGLGDSAICMNCHQGRASKATVDSKIASAGVGDDTPSSSISFSNIHYYAAGATLMGKKGKGGYEYNGKSYDAKFTHVDGYNGCTDCHDPHSLEIKIEQCDTCHSQVANGGELQDIRYYGSLTDYDGDGDVTEGTYYELEGLKTKLYAAIQAYAKQVLGFSIGYESHSYPYFFNDSDGDGTISSSEANYGNQYRNFSPRLSKAAYNYQVALKDPGAFAHGGKYIMELLYDSMEDLGSVTPSPVSMSGMRRADEGHFNGSTEAWRHWDGEGEVSASCAKCHSATGIATFLATGENAEGEPIANGMLCTTCHSSPPGVRSVGPVTFPSGKVADMGDGSNLCMLCHQGRASKKSIDSKIAGGGGDYGFTNIHYFPVAAVLFGTEVKGGYEYAGKTYVGQRKWPNHEGKFDTCVECHMSTKGKYSSTNHNVRKPNPADCVYCHGRDSGQPKPGANPDNFKFSGIRPASAKDYDGDGDRNESLKYEIKGLEEALYARIQVVGNNIGKPIIYDSHAYPYFFNDSNANGVSDPGEAIYPNKYSFNAKLLKAAYNYQTSKKEPHGYIHNSMYIAQLLVDSIGDLGGNVAPYTWR